MIFQTHMIVFRVNLQGCNHAVNPNGPFDENASRRKKNVRTYVCKAGPKPMVINEVMSPLWMAENKRVHAGF